MSYRFLFSLLLVIVVGAMIGVLGVMLVQSLHLFAAPASTAPSNLSPIPHKW